MGLVLRDRKLSDKLAAGEWRAVRFRRRVVGRRDSCPLLKKAKAWMGHRHVRNYGDRVEKVGGFGVGYRR